MVINLNGTEIKNESDFHKQISKSLDLNNYYGANLDALWDLLTASVERPLVINWENSAISKKNLGDIFTQIAELFNEVKQLDEKFGYKDKFDYHLN